MKQLTATTQLGWSDLLSGGIEVYQAQGDHETYIREHVRAVAQQLILVRVQVETNNPRPCGNAAQALRVGGQFG
jgi:hypothetical protein